jgi:exodeoxyribonuclease VII small subunit
VVKKNESTIDFEASLKELEALVEKMEQGETSLEQSLKDFERGVALTRACQQALRDAEQKVQILTGTDENSPLQEFEGENE